MKIGMKSFSEIKFLTFLTKRYSRLGMGAWFFLYRRGYLFTLFLPSAITPEDLSVCPHYSEPIGYLSLFLSSVSTSYIPMLICMHTIIYPYTHASLQSRIHTFIHSYIHISLRWHIHTSLHSYIYISLKSHIHTLIHSYRYPYNDAFLRLY